MPTYNGWNVITMPSSPAPKSVEWTRQSIVAVSVSPFTGQQQIQDWNSSWLEASITLPPMTQTEALPWVNFLLSLNGQAGVFQFANALLASLIPAAANASGYWRLKSNSRKWSVGEALIYGFQFDIREALGDGRSSGNGTGTGTTGTLFSQINAASDGLSRSFVYLVRQASIDTTNYPAGLTVNYIHSAITSTADGGGTDGQATVNLYVQLGGQTLQFTLHALTPIPGDPNGNRRSNIQTYTMPTPVLLSANSTWTCWTENSTTIASLSVELSESATPQASSFPGFF